MSVSPFPDPITTNFIPSAWDFTILTRFANFILTYPIAQNAKIAFQTVSVATTAILTQIANTSYVYSAFVALLSAINTWTGLNTFGTMDTGAITTNTITATTLALSGTQLNTPLTPFYAYPVGTATGSNTPSIGTAGTIGFIPETTFITFNTGGGSGVSQRSVSLTQGTWIVAATVRTPGFAGSNAITITTQQNSITPGPIYGRKGTWQYAIAQPTYPWGLATLAIVNLSATTTLYLTIRNDTVNVTNYSNLTCVRIA
jgi:hypothetical protein